MPNACTNAKYLKVVAPLLVPISPKADCLQVRVRITTVSLIPTSKSFREPTTSPANSPTTSTTTGPRRTGHLRSSNQINPARTQRSQTVQLSTRVRQRRPLPTWRAASVSITPSQRVSNQRKALPRRPVSLSFSLIVR
jgi:hypothetical protein